MDLAEIEKCIPSDASNQVEAYHYIKYLASFVRSAEPTIVDLGAATGNSARYFHDAFPQGHWIGIDIADSPPVRKRVRVDLDFRTYDGVNIPLQDRSVDIVFSRQTFEHVRHPEALLKDIARVLKPGGWFAGSVSQLEPFHSFSYWNFTYYGIATIAENAGLRLVEFRPGIDSLTLILRNICKYFLKVEVGMFDPWVKGESPLNAFISGRLARKGHWAINREKIRYCGHLCFLFHKA